VHLIDWRSCRGIVELHLAVIARSGATKQSTLTFLLPDAKLSSVRREINKRRSRRSNTPLRKDGGLRFANPRYVLIPELLCPLLHRYQVVVNPIDRLLVQNLAPDRHSLVEPSIDDG
jgi:hypothetical protein